MATNTKISDLVQFIHRVEIERKNLETVLNTLTTNGAGELYEVKMIVGPDSPLGMQISDLGTSVMRAKSNLFATLDRMIEILKKEYATKVDNVTTTGSQVQNVTNKFDINFTTLD